MRSGNTLDGKREWLGDANFLSRGSRHLTRRGDRIRTYCVGWEKRVELAVKKLARMKRRSANARLFWRVFRFTADLDTSEGQTHARFSSPEVQSFCHAACASSGLRWQQGWRCAGIERSANAASVSRMFTGREKWQRRSVSLRRADCDPD